MKPELQKIFTKLSDEKLEKVEKVELAMKPDQLLKYVNKIDADLRKKEQKIEKSFMQYKQAHKEWKTDLDDIANKVVAGGTEIGQIVRKLNDLGVKPSSLPELVKAGEELNRLKKLLFNLESLYIEPK